MIPFTSEDAFFEKRFSAAANQFFLEKKFLSPILEVLSNKFLILFTALLISSIGYSQYNYEIKLASLNDEHPKMVLNDISNEIDIYKKYYRNGYFLFESKIKYTEEQLSKILSSRGFTIDEFKMTCKKEEYHEK